MKKIAVFCLAVILTFSFVYVSADRMQEANTRALALQALNLFKGTNSGFELDRSPTRMESLITLIRLSGMEKEALEGNWAHPFTDVDEWTDKYAGMAYEKGITKGVSETEFGMAEEATAQQFTTFVLRLLGYNDSDGDFDYEKALDFGTGIGIIDETVDTVNFLRADMVIISFNSLFAKLKDSEKTLSQKLQEDGVFTAEDEKSATKLVNGGSEEDKKDEESQGISESESDNLHKDYDEPDNGYSGRDESSYYDEEYEDYYDGEYYDDGYYDGGYYDDDGYYYDDGFYE